MTPQEAYTNYRISYLERKAKEATDATEKANYLEELARIKPVDALSYLVEETA